MNEISVAVRRERRVGAALVPAAHRYFGQIPPGQPLAPATTDISALP